MVGMNAIVEVAKMAAVAAKSPRIVVCSFKSVVPIRHGQDDGREIHDTCVLVRIQVAQSKGCVVRVTLYMHVYVAHS